MSMPRSNRSTGRMTMHDVQRSAKIECAGCSTMRSRSPNARRGAKGEVWKIEENLPELLETLKQILSTKPGAFFLVNGYAAGYAPRSFAQAIERNFGEKNGECGEILNQESS